MSVFHRVLVGVEEKALKHHLTSPLVDGIGLKEAGSQKNRGVFENHIEEKTELTTDRIQTLMLW